MWMNENIHSLNPAQTSTEQVQETKNDENGRNFLRQGRVYQLVIHQSIFIILGTIQTNDIM